MISVDKSHSIWEHRYRPQTIEECILPEDYKNIFRGIIKDGRCDNLILVSRSPGTGKTTTARALCHDLDAEMFFVNGSDCKIDFIRNELTRFASTKTMKKGGKIIVIDEFDRKQLVDAQRHMRSFLDAFGSNCSVIITANNADGIIDPLKSRCKVVEYANVTKEEKLVMTKSMIVRAFQILDNEQVEYDKRVVAQLVTQNFPDFRSTVLEMGFYSKKGAIDAGILAQTKQASEIEDLVAAMKDKNFKVIRNLVGRYVHDYPTFITKLYEKLYSEAQPSCIPDIILTIGENQKYYSQVANLEIHISMLLVQLMMDTSWK